MEAVGLVTRHTGINPEQYYLKGDDSWALMPWVVDGTTLELNSSLGITDFEFITSGSVTFGVTSHFTIHTYFDDGKGILFLGDMDATVPTDYKYAIELVSPIRTRSFIYLGGATIADSATVTMSADVIGSDPCLTLGTGLLECGGVSTNGTNVWQFGDADTGTVTPTGIAQIIIDGTTYSFAVEAST
jgi:hypothetical protein